MLKKHLKKMYRVLNTICRLKPGQIYNRVVFYLKNRPLFKLSIVQWIKYHSTTLAPENLNLIYPVSKTENSLTGKFIFKFLNNIVFYTDIQWNDLNQEKLWVYNLHYFDYLHQNPGKPDQVKYDNAKLILSDWIEKNPIGLGNGWEPYPLSLRIVNWIFYFDLYHNKFKEDPDFEKRFLNSLHKQSQYLSFFFEYHLMANHLWANIKALLFAGVYFNNIKWSKKAAKLFNQELKEQFFDDGAHFELSPMYHSIMTNDILDIINLLSKVENNEFIKQIDLYNLENIAGKMLRWLKCVCHPDGDIPLLGDSAFNIAPDFERLEDYFQKCTGHNFKYQINEKIAKFEDSGLFVFRAVDQYLIVDGGKLGVDYQPGHIHCDIFNYEYSYKKKRFIVDSGVGDYLPAKLRTKARSIYSHNTVVINGLEQAEIWQAFRVGRRVKNIFADLSENTFRGEYVNDIWRKQKYIHKREISIINDSGFLINDFIKSDQIRVIENLIHIHPKCEIEQYDDGIKIDNSGDIIHILFDRETYVVEMRDWFYVPEFGNVIDNKVIVLSPKKEIWEFEYLIIPEANKNNFLQN